MASTKLTQENVDLIRKLSLKNKVTNSELAKRFNISPSYVSKLTKYKCRIDNKVKTSYVVKKTFKKGRPTEEEVKALKKEYRELVKTKSMPEAEKEINKIKDKLCSLPPLQRTTVRIKEGLKIH